MQFCFHRAWVFVSMLNQCHRSFHIRRCMVMFLGGARVKYFSAASRPDACFLLVATPPLKVFRQPCTVTQVCLCHFVRQTLIMNSFRINKWWCWNYFHVQGIAWFAVVFGINGTRRSRVQFIALQENHAKHHSKSCYHLLMLQLHYLCSAVITTVSRRRAWL